MSNNYFPSLDSFRAFAILFVIISHMGLDHIIPGGFGVTLFFFISGFLITRLLIMEFDKKGTIDLKSFYIRRLLRLYPALLLMLLVASGIVMILGCKTEIKPYLFSGLFYYTNYYLVYFSSLDTGSCGKIYDILWSLSIEEHFYLFFPFLFFFLYKRSNFLFYTLVALTLAMLCIRLYLVINTTDYERTKDEIYYSTHTRLDSITFGCLSAMLIFKFKSKLYLKIVYHRLSIAASLLLIIFTLLFRSPFFRETFRYSLQGLALMIIVPAVIYLPGTSHLKRLFENKVLVFIGQLSYSLYLFHWVSLNIANSFYTAFTFNWLVTMVLLTIILSLSSYYFVERPVVSLRRKFGSNVS